MTQIRLIKGDFMKHYLFTLLALGLLAFSASCSDDSTDVIPPYLNNPPTGGGGGTDNGGGGDNGGGTDNGGGDDSGFIPNLSYSFTVKGNSGAAAVWHSGAIPGVDNILKVRVKAKSGGAVSVPGYENYSINAGCFQYEIGVKDATNSNASPVTVTTGILKANGASWGSCTSSAQQMGKTTATEFVYDFSGTIANQSGKFEIVVQDARYDFYCQLYPSTWVLDPMQGWYNTLGSIYQNCVVRNVYSNHSVKGTVEVQTNLTDQ